MLSLLDAPDRALMQQSSPAIRTASGNHYIRRRRRAQKLVRQGLFDTGKRPRPL